ncbi:MULTISPECIES: hypothetical protein [Bacillus cereus group]|uniref:hypothetical protein n=1 Tax=Bacillus cereus group TaxID=86661 RepID=UPI00148378CF|nr:MULTISPECIES: hypothetical protein [Bacillus cereus group]MDH4422129.1 hypothetical protein [Bacillus cereus]
MEYTGVFIRKLFFIKLSMMTTINTVVKSIQYGMAEPGVLEVLRELLDIMNKRQ